MPEQVPFIGRKSILKEIDNSIKNWGHQNFIFVHGEGGIGKTRLLQEIRNQYINDKDIITTEIIDFDDKSYHISENIGEKIARMLDKTIFEPYFIALMDYHKMEIAGVSAEALRNKFEEGNQIFISCFNKSSAINRVILFIDTIEALSDNNYWDYLIQMTMQIKNYLVIVAGHNANDYGKSLQSLMGKDKVHILKLSEFKEEERIEYLNNKKRILNHPLGTEISAKIIRLSNGRPILIDLAMERLSRDIPFEWLFNEVLLEDNKKKEFEYELVIHLAQCRTQRDILILLMSYVYPLNDVLISILLESELNDAQKLYSEVKGLCFIKCLPKGYIKLHDEMQRMVNEHVWMEADPEGYLRQKYSHAAISYFEEAIQLLTQNISILDYEEKHKDRQESLKYMEKRWPLVQARRKLKVELLRHTLFLNIEDGFALFIDLFDEATRKPQFSLRDMLLTQIKPHTQHLSDKQLYELKSRHAKHLMDRGDYTEAKKETKDILRNIKTISPSQKVDTLMQLGNIKMRLGRHTDGIINFMEAINICEDNKFDEQYVLKPTVMRLRNALGWGYRKIMKYDDAIKQYDLAFELSLFLNDRLEEAKIINNLAYAYAKKGDTSRAHNLAREAKELWIELDNKEGLGSLYHVYSEIYNNNDNLDDTIRYSKKALDIFKELEHNDWIERLCSELGKYYWERADINLANSDHKAVNDDLNEAENILKKVSKGQYKIESRHYLAHVYITKSLIQNDTHLLDKAQKIFEQACKESKEESFFPMRLNSMGDLVYIAMKKREYEKIEKIEEEYENLFLTDVHLKGEEGILLKYFGDFYLCKEPYSTDNIDKAIKYYIKGIPLISNYKERTSYSLIFQIKDIQRRLYSSTYLTKVKIELGKKLSALWKKDPKLLESHTEALRYFIRWQKGTEVIND